LFKFLLSCRCLFADNVCSCNSGWGASDCSEDLSTCPVATSITPTSGQTPTVVTVGGNYFYDLIHIKCNFGSHQTSATVNSQFELTCPLPTLVHAGPVTFTLSKAGCTPAPTTTDCSSNPVNPPLTFTFNACSGCLDPHFFGFHGEKVDIVHDDNANNEYFHLYCSESVSIMALFAESEHHLLFMTAFNIRLGNFKFSLGLGTTPIIISTDYKEPTFIEESFRTRIEFNGGHLEWDEKVLRVKFGYLQINFAHKIYLNGDPYMDITLNINGLPTETQVTGLIGRTLFKALTPEEFENYLQFKVSTQDFVSFSCSVPFDTI